MTSESKASRVTRSKMMCAVIVASGTGRLACGSNSTGDLRGKCACPHWDNDGNCQVVVQPFYQAIWRTFARISPHDQPIRVPAHQTPLRARLRPQLLQKVRQHFHMYLGITPIQPMKR
jgi:hypothetical protein